MAKTAYEIWKENEEKKKVSKPGPRRDSVQYNKSNYTGESLTRSKNYDWEKGLLKNLPSEYGKSYDKKFESWAASKGMDKSEAREFRTWMDSKEDGVDTKSRLTDGILNLSNRRAEERAKSFGTKKPGLDGIRKPTKERDGVLGFLDSFLGRASRKAHELTIGKDFVKAQDENYRDQAEEKRKKFNTSVAKKGSALDQYLNTTSRAPKNGLEKAADIFGTGVGIASYIAPGTAAETIASKGLNALKLTKGGSQIASNLAIEGTEKGLSALAKGTTKSAIKGGASGLTFGLGESGLREVIDPESNTLSDHAKRIGMDTALGAIGNPLLDGAGQLASNGLARLAKGEVPEFTGKPSPDVLDRLAPLQNKKTTDHTPLYDRLQSLYKKPETEVPENVSPSPTLDRLRKGADFEPIEVEPDIDGGKLIDTQAKGLRAGRDYELIEATDEGSPLLRLRESLQRPKQDRDYEPIEAMKGNGGKLSQVNFPSQKSLESRMKQLQPASKKTEDLTLSFRSKVNRNPKKENKLDNVFSNLRTQFIDDLSPLEKLEKNVRGNLASAEDSLYKQARLFKGSSEKSNQIVETRLTPILKRMKQFGFSSEDLGDYALAVHARDVNAKGIKSGFTNEEVDAVINKIGTPEMENARKELVNLNNDLLNTLADTGVLSKETVENMQKKHPNYMPLFRSFDDEKVDFSSGIQQSLANVANPIKKLEGSDRQVIDPIESIVKNIFKLNNAADRNKVANQLGKLASEDTNSDFVRRLNPGEETGRKNVVSVLENGQKAQYEVPPEVYKAMKNMDKEQSNFLIKTLQKPASTLRAGATLTPEFSLRNPMRDVPQAFIVSNSGFNPLIDFPVGLFQSALKGKSIKIAGKEIKTPDKMYRQFIEDNGGLGNIVSVDRQMHKEAIEKALKSDDKRFMNIVNPKAWLGVLRSIADVTESATKVGEYRAALRSGASREEAAYRARDIMDFARSGVSIRETNKVVAFLNANIQGKSKLLRAIKENPMKVTAKSLTAITMPTIGAYLAQKTLASDEQKQLINDAPSWLKNTFWLIPVPGTEQVARIPKPFDLGPIFANLPERTLKYIEESDPEAFDNFARETLSSFTVPTMLTGIAPIIEGMANYSFFREGPIIPRREENVDFPDQHDINTSESAKLIGKGINAITQGQGTFKNFGSPRVIDNTIRGFTGGLGTYATDSIDVILEGSGVVGDDVEKPKKDFLTEQTPLRAFLMNESSTGESVDKLYSLLDKLSRQRGSAKSKDEDFSKEEEYEEIKDSAKEVSDISKEIRLIQNDSYMSADEKRVEIDRLNKRRNEIAFNTIRSWRNQ